MAAAAESDFSFPLYKLDQIVNFFSDEVLKEQEGLTKNDLTPAVKVSIILLTIKHESKRLNYKIKIYILHLPTYIHLF